MRRLLLLLSLVGLLIAQSTAPRVKHRVEPKYTDAAREAKISGVVLLSLVIDAEGVPDKIRVIRPLGYGLDEKAIEALSQWRFQPATNDGKPVPTSANVEINFRLMSSPAPQ